MAYDWSDSLLEVDWEELSQLYKIAPLGHKPPEALKLAFSGSLYRCFVREQGRLVGVGRALADGVDCSYICDIAVHPAEQGSGLGRQIVARLIEMSKGHKKIILYAVPGREGFYAKFGFKPMTTAMAIFADPAQAAERGLIREA
jgi:ribosomal protein S18 acetylase RimI-like enzyme